jgi:CheY-like chemotaxis protein
MARILIIDDDDLLRNVLVKTLTQAGHSVVEAADGAQGMNVFHASSVDLVITDLVMPVQEGVETIMALKRERPDLPVIAMSGGVSNAPLYLDIASKVGANTILPKPFTPQQLDDAISEVL